MNNSTTGNRRGILGQRTATATGRRQSAGRQATAGILRILLLGILVVASHTAMAGKRPLIELTQRQPAPPLDLQDVHGNRHRLSDYRGRVVIVNFWATWCPPCRAEMPSMQRAWQQLQDDGAIMLAVAMGEDQDDVLAFLERVPVDFPVLLDQDSAVTRAWPVRGLPTTYVVDPRGRLAYRAVGGREWDDAELLRRIRTLADDSGAQQ